MRDANAKGSSRVSVTDQRKAQDEALYFTTTVGGWLALRGVDAIELMLLVLTAIALHASPTLARCSYVGGNAVESFLVLGDWGQGYTEQFQVRDAMLLRKDRSSFVLNVGDNFYRQSPIGKPVLTGS